MSAQRSIVICGGAFAGLALAVALRQGLGAEIPVIVADPALGTTAVTGPGEFVRLKFAAPATPEAVPATT